MELMTKKALFAGVAAFALLVGTTGAGAIDVEENNAAVSIGDVENETGSIDHKNAVSANAMQQVVANSVTIELEDGSGTPEGEIVGEALNMAFGHHTFEHQILNVNNFQQGVNQAQQGAISVAVQANFGGI